MGSATSTINNRGDDSSSSLSSLPSHELLINRAIKALVCFSGCGDKSDAMIAACNQVSGSADKKQKCFKAAAALEKCIRDNAAVYDAVVGEADKQQEGKSSQA